MIGVKLEQAKLGSSESLKVKVPPVTTRQLQLYIKPIIIQRLESRQGHDLNAAVPKQWHPQTRPALQPMDAYAIQWGY